ncbi:2OG-Fe(II) oxygenase [Shewanella sp. 5_MG-2023]|uniref:2OG-Fe(II) oxygenase n=1 Tax=Shewanella sp. 5_MG-2023 TaxID=3062656 RepID=UPI0026E335B2|nr:2OG-Fe(II) oxygenase [Shewanella sp. 5_MG-2023]MDO6639316.1 2OG-Fe(II) oxygenase [Shewanella sp. 5_MG-2023]
MQLNTLKKDYESGSVMASFHIALFYLRTNQKLFNLWIDKAIDHELKIAWDFMMSYEGQKLVTPKFIQSRFNTSGFAEYYLATISFKPTKEGFETFASLIDKAIHMKCQKAKQLKAIILENFSIDITDKDELLKLFDSVKLSAKNVSSNREISLYTQTFNSDFSMLIIDELSIYLQPSLILDPVNNQPRLSPHRTAFSAQWLPSTLGFLGLLFEKLITELIDTQAQYGEPMTLLQYLPGQEYKPHFDFINNHEHGYSDGQQRVKTILIGLNSEEYQGGDTLFPNIKAKFHLMCGDILVFNNTSTDGKLLQDSLHQSTPIISGKKTIISKWIRQSKTTYDSEKLNFLKIN